MRLIVDLHIHSKYSRACSPEMQPEGLDLTFGDHYRLSVYGRNLGDERFARVVPIGISTWGNYNPPEHYGVEFTAEF